MIWYEKDLKSSRYICWYLRNNTIATIVSMISTIVSMITTIVSMISTIVSMITTIVSMISTIISNKITFIYHKFIKSYIIPAMKNQFLIICLSALLLVTLSQTADNTCNDATYKAYLEEWKKPIASDAILYNQKL